MKLLILFMSLGFSQGSNGVRDMDPALIPDAKRLRGSPVVRIRQVINDGEAYAKQPFPLFDRFVFNNRVPAKERADLLNFIEKNNLVEDEIITPAPIVQKEYVCGLPQVRDRRGLIITLPDIGRVGLTKKEREHEFMFTCVQNHDDLRTDWIQSKRGGLGAPKEGMEDSLLSRAKRRCCAQEALLRQASLSSQQMGRGTVGGSPKTGVTHSQGQPGE